MAPPWCSRCRQVPRFVEANPDTTDDVLWVRATAVAAAVFDVHLDTGNPISDSGLLAAVDAVMVPMLFAFMHALREQLRHERRWLHSVRAEYRLSEPTAD